jgi:hypothetical protein
LPSVKDANPRPFMAKGDITFIFVGKTKYIDWKANEHVEFPHSEKIRANKEAAV